ncbi:ferredoxin reductase [Methylobacterium nodulans]|uniref:Oxidoreductase FAD-binding domain protein n=1 Tax=Methylobacterium nodulans (strain LMG 21967 / CNCM I-2342 / ORS 2060) TaxID=460265 RepID=B8IK14_METNO|nr:ferredoxin reductase [Methylobacterium nodulans]ACL60027.1 Oxidoreductase FAD-binding domain protein [Methylobacterium nodulans ORS 2060]
MALAWQEAVIAAIAAETPRVKRFTLRPDRPFPFRAGQHVDVRLTAPDGYQAQRSYSIASAPGGEESLDLMIEHLDDGEVSGFFADVAEVGDRIELRGPIGAFTWEAGQGGPLLLVAGGSGVVPLLSMLRHRAAAAPSVPALLLYSARTPEEVIARAELLRRDAQEPAFQLMLNLTRVPGGRRLDAARVAEALSRLGPPASSFVCGGNPFVSTASDLLVDAGVAPETIRTERFGG